MTGSNLPGRVALLSSGPPIALKVLYCLQALEIETDLIDLGRPCIARHSRYRRKYRRLDLGGSATDGLDAIHDALRKHVRENGIDGLIGGDIRSAGVLHELGDRFPDLAVFPSASMETLHTLDDKWRFSRFMEANDIPRPWTLLLEDLDQLDGLATSLEYPLMVKPTFGESGHGVVRIDSIGALRAHLASGSRYAGLPLLLQGHVQGQDADISVLAADGRIVGHVLHARKDGCTLEFMRNEQALHVAERIVGAAKYSGVANIDLRIDGKTGRVTVLECNPRFWYTLQASLWRGVNFVEAGFRLAVGQAPHIDTPADGVYHLHGCLLSRMLWHPARWRRIPGYNLRGLWQALSDPFPFLRDRG